jgi:hypothetical protein
MRAFLTGSVMALALLGASCRQPTVTIRPGCEFRVMDADTGLPIQDARITVVTLYAAKDTVGRWNLVTDDEGYAGIVTIRETRRREALAGRKPVAYQFVAGLQAEGYQYYSLSIVPGLVVVRLSRNYPVACL